MAKHTAVKPPVPTEHKVIQPTAVSAVLGVVLAVLNSLAAGPGILDAIGIPKVYQGMVIAVVPSLVVLVSGYLAPHTDRPDLVESGHIADGTITLAPPIGSDADVYGKGVKVERVAADPEPPTCGH